MENKKKIDTSDLAQEVIKVPISEFIPNYYIPFAQYVMTSRAIISKDGLKPIHRKMLYTMYEEKLVKGKVKKAKNIIGKVTEYSPHEVGNDTLASLAQEFNLRVPLAKVQGSVGIHFGDSPAKERYYEIGLSLAGELLVKDIADNSVLMIDNYNETGKEPQNLPIRFPVGIINGTEGIAVGYASKLPPHNPNEIMDLCIKYVEKDGDITTKDISKIVKGPDFPTGATIVSTDEIETYLETGKGKFKIRSKYTLEAISRGRHRLVFYELPYQVSVESILKTINEYNQDKKKKQIFSGISTMKDLSSKKIGLCFEIIIKNGINPKKLIQDLFKHTNLEISYSTNMNVLNENKVVKYGMYDLIKQFIDFRKECIFRKIKNSFDIDSLERHKLKGFTDIDNIDKLIDIIKNSENTEDAINSLMKVFKIDELQAQYILSLSIRKLIKSDRQEILDRINDLTKKVDYYYNLLNNPLSFKNYLLEELKETKKVIESPRRTQISNLSAEDLKEEEKIIKELAKSNEKEKDCYITLYENNIITKTTSKNLLNYPVVTQIKTTTKQEIMLINNNGEYYKIQTSFIPNEKETNLSLLELKDNIVGLAKETMNDNDIGLLCVTNLGNVNIIKSNYPKTADKDIVISLLENEKLIYTNWINNNNVDSDLYLCNENSFVSCFNIKQIRPMNPKSKAIKGMDTNCKLVGAGLSNNKNDIVVSISNNSIKSTSVNDIPKQKNRGSKGTFLHKLKKNDNNLIKFKVLNSNLPLLYNLTKTNFIDIPDVNKRGNIGKPFNYNTLL